jgi:hypothetical protein
MIIRSLLLLLFGFLLLSRLSGQSILVAIGGQNPNGVSSLNMVTCELTPVAENLNIGYFVDIWMTPDGTLYLLGYGPPAFTPTLYAHNTATNVTTPVATMGTNSACAMYGLSDTTLLINTSGQFWLYNIPQNTTTLLGTIPGGSFCGWEGEIVEYNGNLYAGVGYFSSGGAPPGTYQINLSPPLTVTLTTLNDLNMAVNVCNNIFGYGSNFGMFGELNLEAPPSSQNQSNPLCFDSESFIYFGSFAPDPFNATGPLCNCTSESGAYTSFSVLSNCNQAPIVLPHNGNATLDADDNLVFMLGWFDGTYWPDAVLEPLVTYSSPVITFVPGVTVPGETYAVFAVAGNALGNSVDLNDPCTEVSRYHLVQWDESPSVSFTAPTDICSNGQCQTIQVNLAGQPPFTLAYRVTAGSSVQNLTQVFNSNSGSIQLCPPAGYTGPINVQATSLTTPNCSCN